MSDLTELEATKTLAIARLKECLGAAKPTYTIDGQTVSWTEYARMLREQITGLNALIAEQNAVDGTVGEEFTTFYT